MMSRDQQSPEETAGEGDQGIESKDLQRAGGAAKAGPGGQLEERARREGHRYCDGYRHSHEYLETLLCQRLQPRITLGCERGERREHRDGCGVGDCLRKLDELVVSAIEPDFRRRPQEREQDSVNP